MKNRLIHIQCIRKSLQSFLTLVFVLGMGTSFAQNQLTSYEWWFNDDIASKTVVPITPASTHHWSTDLATDGLPIGFNRFTLRYKDSQGRYSIPLTKNFVKFTPFEAPTLALLVEYEYWFNNDISNKVVEQITPTNFHHLTLALDLDGIPEGINKLSLRYKDEKGVYSAVNDKVFVNLLAKPEPNMPLLVAYEIWFNDDLDNKIVTSITPTATHHLVEEIDVSLLDEGVNVFNIRYKTSEGTYSSTRVKTFVKLPARSPSYPNNKLITYRYWFDDNVSNAYYVTLQPSTSYHNWVEDLPIPGYLAMGEHSITIQYEDEQHVWSIPLKKGFYKLQESVSGQIFVNNSSGCQNSTFTFSGENYAPADSIYWNFGDGSPIVGKLASETIQHQFTGSGVFQVVGTFKYAGTGSTGPDIINVTVYPSYENLPTQDVTICLAELPYQFGTQELTEAGYAQETFQSIHGCDSIASINLTIIEAVYGVDVKEACESFTWINGVVYTESNFTATHPLTSVNGCDSIVTLNLTIHEAVTGVDVQEACGSFTWINGVIYTQSNFTATHPLTSVNGCDSIVTLNLTISESVTGIDVKEACGPFTWIDGLVYTESNFTATHPLTSVNGCDSIVTLNLTIHEAVTGVDVQEACGSFTWINGVIYTQSNFTATHPLTSVNGCDSIVTLNLTIHESVTGIDVKEACGSFTWINGVVYTESNFTATHPLTSVNGCDSIVTLNLTIHESVTGIDVQEACGSFTWIDGLVYTESNFTATHPLTSVNGCDSIVTLNLTIHESVTGIDVQEACGSFTWINGVVYTESNFTATHPLTSVNGCDSIVTLNLTISESVTGIDVQEACGSFTWIDGLVYTESNFTATHPLTSVNGCDSIVTLNLTINNFVTGTAVVNACSSYTWVDGVTYTENNNEATYPFTSASGCDSIVTLNLTIHNSSFGTDVIEACESYTWIDGITYSENNNSAYVLLSNVHGCDSIVTLNLTIHHTPSNGITQNGITLTANQEGASYQWLDCNTNQTPIEGATGQSFTPTDNGSYAVEITTGECSVTSFCYTVTNVGIEENELNSIQVFPNPNTGLFQVDLGETYNSVAYIITDLQGKIIQVGEERNMSSFYVDLDVARGVYILRLNNDSLDKTMKIIVQ